MCELEGRKGVGIGTLAEPDFIALARGTALKVANDWVATEDTNPADVDVGGELTVIVLVVCEALGFESGTSFDTALLVVGGEASGVDMGTSFVTVTVTISLAPLTVTVNMPPATCDVGFGA